ncbi:MAG TPA: XrtA/PEP-CTERM system histidine kinase PrsK [Nitrospiraceae bacterium]|nr:XrtA/PEP-CTERM system histidine kinase PrsK [Nitrospiraceae bacterium]
MIPPTWFSVAAFLVAAISGGMACVLFVRKQSRASHRSFAALLGATAVANLANGLGLFDEGHALFWRGTAMVAELVQPAALLYVGLTFLRPAEGRNDTTVLWRARIVGCVGILLAGFVATGQVFEWKVVEEGRAAIALTTWGRIPYAFIVIGMVLGLAQLELVLRASREPVRHKLKFVIIGLGGLAGYQIYQASQMLLLPVWQAEHVLVGSVVTIMALGLTAFGLGRNRLREVIVNTYVSPQALFGSVTFIVIGLYLLAVGVVGEWLRRTNQPMGVGLSVVVVFGALVGLVIAAFSKTVRADVRRFLYRNFYRSKYDYRAQWLQVTEAFEQAASKEAIMDRLFDLLIKTFPTTAISIWSFREADRRFCQIRSMTTEKEPAPLELSHPVIVRLLKEDEPMLIGKGPAGSNDGAASSVDPLAGLGAALCFPIRAQGQLTAFVALGRQLRGEAYGTDDHDLLYGIAHHVGVLLSHANLAEDRQAATELEALHRFSVFCLHDLKNLAARLSLVAQNAENHGKDPAFQESAMRTVADTAKKMTTLMSKLSLKSFKPMSVAMPESIDMSNLIDETVASIRGEESEKVHVSGKPVPPVMAVREQIHQVLLNVVLNAKQAIGEKGDISIAIEQSNGSVVVTVDDTGCGIPSPMIESLFRPSQSSRPGGLGIGLYQCKQIVEAHRGTIQIRSEMGKGTQVRIELPLTHLSTHTQEDTVTQSRIAS